MIAWKKIGRGIKKHCFGGAALKLERCMEEGGRPLEGGPDRLPCDE